MGAVGFTAATLSGVSVFSWWCLGLLAVGGGLLVVSRWSVSGVRWCFGGVSVVPCMVVSWLVSRWSLGGVSVVSLS